MGDVENLALLQLAKSVQTCCASVSLSIYIVTVFEAPAQYTGYMNNREKTMMQLESTPGLLDRQKRVE